MSRLYLLYNRYMEKVYIAIDLKSFYASVECVERGLDPLKAKLVVADPTRTEKTICLAVSPALKELGLSGRARLYEVYQKARNIDFIIAPPRMQKYLEISTKIYNIYSTFVAPIDIHVYSIDEVFIDATSYLKAYKMTPHELAQAMILKVLEETGITATAGIGSNLYLAKIAMDIKAKHQKADENGVRIAELTERTYREELWDHQPLTDFWRIGRGTAKRLNRLGIHTQGELARYSLTGSKNLYKAFGVNAELIIDHAWGYEPVTLEDVRNYRSKNHSLSEGQVLSEPYPFEKARVICMEMADQLSLMLGANYLETDQIVVTVNYDKSNMTHYKGATQIDHYGREIPKHTHGTINLDSFSSSSKEIIEKVREFYNKNVNKALTVHDLNLSANHIRTKGSADGPEQLDLFVDYDKKQLESEKDRRRQEAILKIKKRYGKNAILRGTNFEEGATMRDRNRQIGGHKA